VILRVRISQSSFIFSTHKEKIMSTNCPECAAEITLEAGTEVGEIIVCPDCGVDLEVTSVEPPAVQLAPMEQEDWGE
jgi:alpha-aminoadipate carrier protein LysW